MHCYLIKYICYIISGCAISCYIRIYIDDVILSNNGICFRVCVRTRLFLGLIVSRDLDWILRMYSRLVPIGIDKFLQWRPSWALLHVNQIIFQISKQGKKKQKNKNVYAVLMIQIYLNGTIRELPLKAQRGEIHQSSGKSVRLTISTCQT